MKSGTLMLVALLILSITPMLYAAPHEASLTVPVSEMDPWTGEMIAVPEELFETGTVGFLGPGGPFFFDRMVLIFEDAGWMAMSHLIRAEHIVLAEEAVKEAVAPLLGKITEQETRISQLKGGDRLGKVGRAALAVLTAAVCVETLILVAK